MSLRRPARRPVRLGLAGGAAHCLGLADEAAPARLLTPPDGLLQLMRHASAAPRYGPQRVSTVRAGGVSS